MKDNWLDTDLCTGCNACADKCPKHCISMVNVDGCRKPSIDFEKCVNCYQCKQVCPNFTFPINPGSLKKAYIAYYKERSISVKSSSGGIFTALAAYILSHHGIVYGATIAYENKILVCKHIRIDDMNDIPLLQGSKYAQSRLDGIYNLVKGDLAVGKTVLFSGTSCQIASLRNFVGNQEQLYTVDLVCHGVPKDKVFYDYLDYLGDKYKGHVENIAFRSKKIWHQGVIMPYTIQAKIRKNDSKVINKYFIRPKSSFYRLFSNRAGYRESCYQCKYASLSKPGDITLGDFRPLSKEIELYGLKPSEHYSSVFVHNAKGNALLTAISKDIWSYEIPIKEMLKHHLNLQHPSMITESGRKYYDLYKKGGFQRLHNYVIIVNFIIQVKHSLWNLLSRVLKNN